MPARVQNTKTNLSLPSKRSSYTEAVTGPDAENWIPAIFDKHEYLDSKLHVDLMPITIRKKSY